MDGQGSNAWEGRRWRRMETIREREREMSSRRKTKRKRHNLVKHLGGSIVLI